MRFPVASAAAILHGVGGCLPGNVTLASTPAPQIYVTELRAEYGRNPIGIDGEVIRLDWQLRSSARNVRQSAYQLRVSGSERDLRESGKRLFDSGKVASEQSIQIPFRAIKLQSRRRYYWQVRVWDGQGRRTRWSDPAFWEMGLLSGTDWQARWIAPSIDGNPLKSTPAPLLRSKFHLRGNVVRARAYVTGLGAYELYLNGTRVGDRLLTPGWTSYGKRIQYQTYDVTALLREGGNAVGAILGDGWYRRVSFGMNKQRNNGRPLALLAQIEVEYGDGRTQTIASDDGWKSASGPILMSELYNGEVYDARLERDGWSTAGYDDREWTAVKGLPAPSAALIATVGPPVRRIDELVPARIFKTPSGETVADMGQNMVGWVRLRVRGPAGTKIVLRHAEALDGKGNLYTANLRSAEQRVQYILKGADEEVFEPHFTLQGFRYAGIEGYPGDLDTRSLTGIVIHSDLEQTGYLETSNPSIDRLQHNILWTQKANFIEAPTDCPQRDERLGFGYDAAIFSATAMYNRDTAGFFTKWLGDLAADQTEDGAVPAEAPRTLFFEHPVKTFYQSINHPSTDDRMVQWVGLPGYGDALTIIPWNLYVAYGDTGLLKAQYPFMKRWVRYVRQQAGDSQLWHPILSLGDWLDVSTTVKPAKIGETPLDLMATAYYARSVDILRRTALVLGESSDAAHYAQLFESIRGAFNRQFVSSDGHVGTGTQTAQVLALDFDLLPENLRPLAARHLADDVRARGHLTTGIGGTQHLLNVLSRFGHDEEAYLLFTRQEMPSWLYPVTRGATTIWERWDGIKPDGSFQNPEMNSFNHFALGAVGEWMYAVMAGIAPDPAAPAYKHSFIAPRPGGGLTYVKAGLDTPYGRLSAHWKRAKGRFTLEIEVPPNTRSTVRLPRAVLAQVEESAGDARAPEVLEKGRQEAGGVVVEVGSGKYGFSYPFP